MCINAHLRTHLRVEQGLETLLWACCLLARVALSEACVRACVPSCARGPSSFCVFELVLWGRPLAYMGRRRVLVCVRERLCMSTLLSARECLSVCICMHQSRLLSVTYLRPGCRSHTIAVASHVGAVRFGYLCILACGVFFV